MSDDRHPSQTSADQRGVVQISRKVRRQVLRDREPPYADRLSPMGALCLEVAARTAPIYEWHLTDLVDEILASVDGNIDQALSAVREGRIGFRKMIEN
jgi:hypothetical protein